MLIFKSRIERERITVGKMIDLFCRLEHKSKDGLCEDCSSLKNYAFKRLHHCPYQDEKPTCLNCTIHCYRKNEKEMIKKVMRFSGPKMLLHHPVMAIWHLIDNRKKKQAERKIRESATAY